MVLGGGEGSQILLYLKQTTWGSAKCLRVQSSLQHMGLVTGGLLKGALGDSTQYSGSYRFEFLSKHEIQLIKLQIKNTHTRTCALTQLCANKTNKHKPTHSHADRGKQTDTNLLNHIHTHTQTQTLGIENKKNNGYKFEFEFLIK